MVMGRIVRMLARVRGSRSGGRRGGGRTAGLEGERWDDGARWRGTVGSYGEYYPRSALVYSAIKLRQDAVARAPLVVYRADGERVVGAGHAAQRLLDRPNPFWTRGELWRATETYLGLWGSAFWGLERDGGGRVAEIWPLRPDRMRVVPDEETYVRGFVYMANGQEAASYLPEDVVWMRYFNPLEEYAGLSPMAPLRLSADVGLDALRASRSALLNDSAPGILVETQDTPTDDEVEEFYERWESRFQGVDRVRRPALMSGGMSVRSLGFSPREMEYVQSMKWSLEDVSRVYGVPKPMLSDIEHVTFSNFNTARRVFWEDTIVPQLGFYEEALNAGLMPSLGDGTLRARFDLSEVEALRETENDKAKRRIGYVKAGIMTVEEVREEMGMGG